MIQKILRLIPNSRKILLGLILLGSMVSTVQILTARTMGQLTGIAAAEELSGLVKPALYTGALFLLQAVLNAIFLSCRGIFSANSNRILQKHFTKILTEVQIAWMDRYPKGDLHSRFQECSDISEFIGQTLPDIAFQTLRIFLFIFYMALLDLYLTCAYLICTIIVVAIQSTIVSPLQKRLTVVKDAQGSLSSLAQDILTQRRTIKIYGAQESLYGKFKKRSHSVCKAEIRSSTVSLPLKVFGWLSGIFPILLLCSMGLSRVATGAVTLSALISMYYLAQNIMTDLLHYTEMFSDLSRGNASIERYLTIISGPREAEEWLTQSNHDEVGSETENDALIQFSEIEFSYKNENSDQKVSPVLQDISFSVFPGQIVMLVGTNGSGKSTILRLAAGLEVPNRGGIFMRGRSYSSMSLDEIRSQLALVRQDSFLFSVSLKENFRLIDSNGDIEAALRDAQVTLDLSVYAGEGGGALSGGERQRISLARGLYSDVPILLLDEATASLDAKTECRIMSVIKNRNDYSAVLMTAHRLSVVQYADVVIFLDQGMVIASGTHSNLLDSCDQYSRFWENTEEEVYIS